MNLSSVASEKVEWMGRSSLHLATSSHGDNEGQTTSPVYTEMEFGCSD